MSSREFATFSQARDFATSIPGSRITRNGNGFLVIFEENGPYRNETANKVRALEQELNIERQKNNQLSQQIRYHQNELQNLRNDLKVADDRRKHLEQEILEEKEKAFAEVKEIRKTLSLEKIELDAAKRDTERTQQKLSDLEEKMREEKKQILKDFNLIKTAIKKKYGDFDIREILEETKEQCFCSRCGGDGGATGNCPKCSGTGWEMRSVFQRKGKEVVWK